MQLNAKLQTAKNEQRANLVDQINDLLNKQFGASYPLEINVEQTAQMAQKQAMYSGRTLERIQFIQTNQIAQKLNNFNVFYKPE